LNYRASAAPLPCTRQRILNSGNDFMARDITATICHASFEQCDNFNGGQMRVQLTGDTVKPVVNTFTGSRRSGERFFQKTWKLAGHGNLPLIVDSSPQMFVSEPSISSSSSTIFCNSAIISSSRFCGAVALCGG
jgi:hypothetical protein